MDVRKGTSRMKKVIIIGGGIGGLATANILAKAGYDVTVLEKNDSLGGRAGLLRDKGFTFDTGPSWYLMPEVFSQYFDLFDVSVDAKLDIQKLSPAYKVYFENEEPVTITGDINQDKNIFEEIENGAGKKLERYIKSSKQIYDMSLKHFLYTNFSSPRDAVKKDIVKKSAKMLSLTATNIDRYVSRYFKDHRLKKILEYSMVFLGSSPFDTPAIYSLMSALDFEYGVFYPRKGMYSIIELLHDIGKDLGVKYELSTDVTNIIVENNKAVGVKLSSGRLLDADIVVSNSDLYHTENYLLAPKYRQYSEKYWKKRNPGPSAMMMYLGIKGKLPDLEHHTLLFIDEWKENFDDIYVNHKIPKKASIYLSKATANNDKLAPEGCETLVVLVPWPSGIDVPEAALEKYADLYLYQIAKTIGMEDLKKRIVYKHIIGPNNFGTNFYAWQNTALGPAHTLKQSAIFRFSNKSKKVKNLYYVGGSTLPGIGLPMCLISAQLVYKRLINDRRGGPIKKIIKIHE